MRLVLFSSLSLLSACAFDPTGIREAPPAIYREWYARVEACSGLKGDFDKIKWQHTYNIEHGGKYSDGYWYPPHTITIRDDAEWSERVVEHEEVHDLLQSGDHPSLYFQTLCGDLMTT